MVATLAGTAVAVGLAELYSELLGAETRMHRRVGGAELRDLLDDAGAVAFGISFPAVFFLLSAAGAMEIKTAFMLATWSGLGLIAFYGFCAARLSGASMPASLLHALAVGIVGGALIALKALVH
jgi:hypothetical protein